MQKITFIINGRLRKVNNLNKDLYNFFSSDFIVEIKKTQAPNHATQLVQQAINEGTDVIISVGGDGTLNEVINGYMLSTNFDKKQISIGLLPYGTGNDFARSVKMKRNKEFLKKLLLNNKIREIDIGQANFKSFENNFITRYFINITDIGIGADTVKIVNQSNKWLGANIAFISGVLKSFTRYKHQNIEFKSESYNFAGKIVSLCIANGKFFGSGLGIAPHADLHNGKFGLVVVGNLKTWDFLKYMGKLKKCEIINNHEITYKSIDCCEITAKDDIELPIDMDGEYIGYLPLKIKIIPKAIKFVME